VNFLGVVTGALLALLVLVGLSGVGVLPAPEGLTRWIAALYAVFPGPVGKAEVARIPCAPLRRLRLYVVCLGGCEEVWRIVGVRGLRATALVSLNRVPAEPVESVRERLNEAIGKERLRLDDAGALEMLGCYLGIAGMRPDLILMEREFQDVQDARGDEVALAALAARLEDPEALSRVTVRQDGDGFSARLVYWDTARIGRPILEIDIRLAADGRLREVASRQVGPTTEAPPGGSPAVLPF
jgi:hypothetical protein